MKTLITGGFGFIGSHLAKHFNNADIYDRKDETTLSNLNKEYDVVIHLAASTYLTEGYDKQMIDDNIILSEKIFSRFKDKRIIYASSAAIYNTNNLYSFSKKYCEDIATEKSTGLRYYNVYGYGDNGIVGKLIKSALTGEQIAIYGGEQTRDFIYVDDVVYATIGSINSDKRIIEIGTGVETSISDLIMMVEKISGKKINCIYGCRIEMEAIESRCPVPMINCTYLEEGLYKTIHEYKKFYKK